MPRQDAYGDKGSKKDRASVHSGRGITGRPAIGSQTQVNRANGTSVTFTETPAGPRVVPGSDTAK